MLTFALPWTLLLLPLPLLVIWFWPAHREEHEGLRVPFLAKLGRLTGQTPAEGAVVQHRARLRLGILWCVWGCIVLALARPQRIDPPITKINPVRDLLLAVDLSGSMETKDFTAIDGKKVERLTAAKQVLADFLKHQQGARVGMIVFGNMPFVQAPFTDDLHVCEELLAEMQPRMAGPKTAFGDAIGLAVSVFQRSDAKERTLVILTDGNDTGSSVPPQKAAEIAREQKITIHVVAIGDPQAAAEEALDEQAIEAVAKTTGGIYAHANNGQELAQFYQRLDQLQTRKVNVETYRPRVELYDWPLGLAILLSMAPFLSLGRW